MEQEMGFEMEGENLKDLFIEMGRIFADEYGFIGSFEVEEDDESISIITSKCLGWNLSQAILSHDTEIPFTCPILNVGFAALKRLGKHVQRSVQTIEEQRGCRISFKFVNE